MKALFVGIGNPLRHDDGAGIALASLVRGFDLPDVTVIEVSDDVVRLIDVWGGYDVVVIADAVFAGDEPGTLHIRDPIADPLPRHWFAISSHQMSVIDVLDLGRVLDRLPTRVLFVGIDARDFGYGTRLSPSVARALPRAAEAVRAQLEATTAA